MSYGVINNPCSKKMGSTVQRTIHGEPLEAVDQHKYGLGIEISSDLNCWNYRQSQQIFWLYKKKSVLERLIKCWIYC